MTRGVKIVQGLWRDYLKRRQEAERERRRKEKEELERNRKEKEDMQRKEKEEIERKRKEKEELERKRKEKEDMQRKEKEEIERNRKEKEDADLRRLREKEESEARSRLHSERAAAAAKEEAMCVSLEDAEEYLFTGCQHAQATKSVSRSIDDLHSYWVDNHGHLEVPLLSVAMEMEEGKGQPISLLP
jgi:hypothetical protein